MSKPAIEKTRAASVRLLEGWPSSQPERPLVMGVLNVTPDSFSDGGRFISVDEACRRVGQLASEGADIIDIGGESTRPGAEPVSLDEELKRVIPVVEAVTNQFDVPVSIDTYKADVAEAALTAGASIVNDISALRMDSRMVEVLRSVSAPVILMHMLGKPRDMQRNPQYGDCVAELLEFFEERLAFAEASGISRDRIIIDPGIGFGKRLKDNLAILSQLEEFSRLRRPVLIGASRKSFINMVHPVPQDADQRIGGSIAAAVTAQLFGVTVVRVHDVHETVEAMKVVQAIREARP